MNKIIFKLSSNIIHIPRSNHNLMITKYIGFNKTNNVYILNHKVLKKYPFLNKNAFNILLNFYSRNNYIKYELLPLDIYNEYNQFCFDHNLNNNSFLLLNHPISNIYWNIQTDVLSSNDNVYHLI
jgi:hypothetical protein